MNTHGGAGAPIQVISDLKGFLLELAQKNHADVHHVVDLEFFEGRLAFWRTHLPKVKPFYAIKTNHDPLIVAELAKLGLSFDCASINEVEQLRKLDVSPDRMIFANPYKSSITIARLKEYGIRRLVFDCEDELLRLIALYPEAELLIRIKTDDSHSAIPLSTKFGAPLTEAMKLVDLAAQKNARLVGVSFHVGSNCDHAPSYRHAIHDAAKILEYGRLGHSLPMHVLDLGGGWPGARDEIFKTIAKTVNDALADVIPHDVDVIAEPGSFFAGQSTTGLVRVIGRKHHHHNGEEQQELFLASGIYGLFFCGYYMKYSSKALKRYGWNFQPITSPLGDGRLMKTTLWGPTCDSIDKIVDDITLPEVASGSWLYTPNLGSYTYALENDFNQIGRSTPLYVRVKNLCHPRP